MMKSMMVTCCTVARQVRQEAKCKLHCCPAGDGNLLHCCPACPSILVASTITALPCTVPGMPVKRPSASYTVARQVMVTCCKRGGRMPTSFVMNVRIASPNSAMDHISKSLPPSCPATPARWAQ